MLSVPDATQIRRIDHLRTDPARGPRFRLAERTALLFMDSRKALFSENRQKLFALNDSAAYLACRLEEGATFQELADDLSGRGVAHATAVSTLRHLLLSWSREEVLVADMPPLAGTACHRQAIAVAGVKVSIGYGNPELSALIGPVFRHMEAEPDQSAVLYDVCEADGFILIGKAGQPASVVTKQQAVPALKALLLQEVMEKADALAALHTACLVSRGRAMLLGGAPGAGKSTLTLALMAAGFGYGGDDVALLGRDGRVRGVPFAPTAKTGAWRLIGAMGHELADMPVHQRLDERRVRYVPPTGQIHSGPIPVRWVVMLKRRKGAPATLAAKAAEDALADLLKEASSPSGRTSADCLRALAGMLSNAQCHELCYSDAAAAVPILKALSENG